MNKTSVFKQTYDNWCGSYEFTGYYKCTKSPLFVEVIFTKTGPNPPIDAEWRVCVWGTDDFGYEKDFLDEKEAWTCFLEVIGWEIVSIAQLKSIGFIPA